MSHEAGHLEMPAGAFRCNGWTVSSENQTRLSLTLQPFLLCWRDYKCNSKSQALKKKGVTAFCLVSVAIVMGLLIFFFSLAILSSSHLILSQPQQASAFGAEASHDPLKQGGGPKGIMMTLERLHQPSCHQGPESYASNAQGALSINAALLQLLVFHKESQ